MTFFQIAAAAILFQWIHPKSLSDPQKYLEKNHAKFECNPTNGS